MAQNKLIIYSKTCLPCTHRKDLNDIKSFAYNNGLGLEIKRTNYNQQHREEAIRVSNLTEPFIYNPSNNISIPISGNYEELIHEQP